MNRIGFVLKVVFCAFSLASFAVDKYYGEQSTEAMLTFKAKAKITLSTDKNITVANLNGDGKIGQEAYQEVYSQVYHLMGSFQAESFEKKFGYKAVLGEDLKIKFLKVKSLGGMDQEVEYMFNGKVVSDEGVFKRQDIVDIPIVLPYSYSEIYALGVDRQGVNHCTDHHYNSEGDFFYFWDPDLESCPLKENSTDVLRLKGKIKILKNTTETFPEYNKLYKVGKADEELEISIFLGYIDDLNDLTTVKWQDSGMIGYKEIQASLEKMGFKLIEKKDAFREYTNGRQVKGINFYRYYRKEVTTKLGNKLPIRVKILLTDTAISSKDQTFHRYLIPAYESSDIVVYDGHSGLGANLSLEYIPDVAFDPERYQIFFFNGCSSYPYYNMTYFDQKGGSKNLDIITSGLPTITSTMSDNVMSMLDGFLKGKVSSYQEILKKIEDSNGDMGTYLTGVNGDEDNKFHP